MDVKLNGEHHAVNMTEIGSIPITSARLIIFVNLLTFSSKLVCLYKNFE